MKSTIYLSLALLLSGGHVFCQNYFPIEPGTEWTYGNLRTSAPNLKMSIAQEPVEWEDKEYAQMKTLTVADSVTQKSVPTILLRKGRKGNLYGINLSVSEDEYLFFPGKVEVGFSWTGLSGLSRITSTKGKIETPSRTFENCVIVESIAGGAKAYSYYQDGKGMVAMTLGDRLLMYLIE